MTAILRVYVSDHQQNWNGYASTLTYIYNIQENSYTKTFPFNLVLVGRFRTFP